MSRAVTVEDMYDKRQSVLVIHKMPAGLEGLFVFIVGWGGDTLGKGDGA